VTKQTSRAALLVFRLVNKGTEPGAAHVRITRLDDPLTSRPKSVSVEQCTADDLVEFVRSWYGAAISE